MTADQHAAQDAPVPAAQSPAPEHALARLRFIPGGLIPENIVTLASALRALLSGSAGEEIIAPYDPADPDYPARTRAELAAYVRAGGSLPRGGAVLVRTSGSTSGRGTAVVLSAAALRASADATHAVMGGPGQWLLALPAHHIAGLQVIARSVIAGYWPQLVRPREHFSPALESIDCPWPSPPPSAARRYLSLVPTQLHDVLAHAASGSLPPALRTCDAILLGGAAADPSVLTAAAQAGIRVITSYGMTETAGGCVYNGYPLPGVTIAIASADNAPDGAAAPSTGSIQRGRIMLCGPMLASAYLDNPSPFFTDEAGATWFRTSDIGEFDGQRLRVIGRADNAITTGGQTVAPEAIESALAAAGIRAGVLPRPHERWGEQVVALLEEATVPHAGSDSALASGQLRAVVREILTRELPPYYVPRRIGVVQKIPRRTLDKIDRRALAVLADSDAVRWEKSE